VAMYALADLFTLDRAKLLCERRVARSLTVDNAAGLLAACDAVEPSMPHGSPPAGTQLPTSPTLGGPTTAGPFTPGGGVVGSSAVAAGGALAGIGAPPLAAGTAPGTGTLASEPSSLKAHVMDYVLANFDAVIKTPAFRDLSRELILDVLARK
jgi:hypothetical protein